MSIYTFQPIYQERIWGGNRLRRLYKRDAPADKKIGESWELVDRPEANSLLTTPEGESKSLHDLWTGPNKVKIFGKGAPKTERFPILIKLLDCVDKLSVQVHPPAAKAAALKGEPKTEIWYFLHTTKKATIYAGLKKGVTRARFEKAIGTPELANLLHTLKPRRMEAMFLPSGRVHAIGGGNLILEVQQNSDTTYRVDDWNRVDDKGKSRELHIKESLESINFNDYEPIFTQPHSERIVECAYFSLYRALIFPGEFRSYIPDGRSFQYHYVARGEVTVLGTKYRYGQAFMSSADSEPYELEPGPKGLELLTVEFGK
ncbi:MAG: type I phosphomannose isomerase catalytic subunit [Candidatus Methylacidiphilales bacterium]|nr:type I phosphomannose isomerase catalytic subunit [Candidatus Methylacidiphilales bacterium]